MGFFLSYDVTRDSKTPEKFEFMTYVEVYSEPCQTSNMEHFAKIVND